MAFEANLLACPGCQHGLLLQADALLCTHCALSFPVVDGMPLLLLEDSPVTMLSHDDYDDHHEISADSTLVMQQMWQTILDEHALLRSTVLEIGSGTGQLTRALADMPAVQQIHATDISPAFLQVAQARTDNSSKACFYTCDANRLPFQDGQFDLIVGNSVLHHLLNYHQVLQQCHRLLKPGGAAVFFEPVLQGKIMIAFLASLMLRIARKTGYGELDPDDEQKIQKMVRHITKAKEVGHDIDRLARMEDKYVFDLHALRDTGLDAGFHRVSHRNNPAQDGQFRFNLHQHLSMAGIADHKISAFRFLLNTAHEMLIEMIPQDLYTPMGFFVFRKAG